MALRPKDSLKPLRNVGTGGDVARKPKIPNVPPPRVLGDWSLNCESPEKANESIQEALGVLGRYQARLLARLVIILAIALIAPMILSDYILIAILAVILILATSAAFAIEVFQAFTWTAFLRSLRLYIVDNREALEEYCSGEAEA